MPRIVVQDCLNCNADHEWLFSSPTLKELRTIKALTGWSGQDYAEHSEVSDPDALAALLYILHQRDKIKLNWEDVDLDFEKFDMIETDEEKAEREKLEKEAEAAGKAAHVKPDPPKGGSSKSGQQKKAASNSK